MSCHVPLIAELPNICICFDIYIYCTGPREKKILQDMFEDTAYICGISLREELDFPQQLQTHTIEVMKHRCHDPIEVLYYSAQVSDVICIHCGSLTDPDWDFNTAVSYPVCNDLDCSSRALVKIKGRRR